MKKRKYIHLTLIVSNYNHRVLAYGMNYIVNKKRSIHSEEQAWYEFKRLIKKRRYPKKWFRKGCMFVNLAVTRAFKIRISRPCTRCSFLITKNNKMISKVIWTTGNNSIQNCCAELILDGAIPSSADRQFI